MTIVTENVVYRFPVIIFFSHSNVLWTCGPLARARLAAGRQAAAGSPPRNFWTRGQWGTYSCLV